MEAKAILEEIQSIQRRLQCHERDIAREIEVLDQLRVSRDKAWMALHQTNEFRERLDAKVRALDARLADLRRRLTKL